MLKCELNDEDECRILNHDLGDCEIEEHGIIVWRCKHYKELALSEDEKK